jgi:CofD-related protein of GAK system
MTSSAIHPARELRIPDQERVARARRKPELGPRILFFTGGTALRETSLTLVGYTHNSIHLVSPFDSGGSSASLRRHFGMPAVGDLRSRLMALADRTRHGLPQIYELFAYRLPRTATPQQLRDELADLVGGGHRLAARVADPGRKVILHYLQRFKEEAGPCFDLRGASIGNLILAAGYLENGRSMDPIASVFSDLVQVRGEVRLTLNADLQLRAELEGGEHIVGQHLLTGKEAPPITRPVVELSLVDPARGNEPVRPAVRDKITAAIQGADLICYPVGSFYSSIVANLLPAGVGMAVSRAACPKVFIPNTFPDPECIGLSLAGQVRILLHHLRADAPDAIAVGDVLDAVLLDPDVSYPGAEDPARELSALGIRVVRTRLASGNTGAIDPHLLCRALVSLA